MINNVSKKTVVIIVVVLGLLGLGVGGWFVWNNLNKSQAGTVSDVAEKIIKDVTKGTLPSLETNPLESKPDLNPADKANPFKDIKINPFE